MNFTNYLGIFIWTWLISGLIAGLLVMFVSGFNKNFNSNMGKIERSHVRNSYDRKVFNVASTKIGMLVLFSISGYIGLFLYITNVFSKK